MLQTCHSTGAALYWWCGAADADRRIQRGKRNPKRKRSTKWTTENKAFDEKKQKKFCCKNVFGSIHALHRNVCKRVRIKHITTSYTNATILFHTFSHTHTRTWWDLTTASPSSCNSFLEFEFYCKSVSDSIHNNHRNIHQYQCDSGNDTHQKGNMCWLNPSKSTKKFWNMFFFFFCKLKAKRLHFARALRRFCLHV